MDVAQRYLSHFSPNFLFITGDTFEIFRVIGTGFLPLLCAPFLLIGLYKLIVIRPPWFKILLLWLLLSPLASSFTIFTPSVSRSMNMVVPLVLFSAYGATTAYAFATAKFGNAMTILFPSLLTSLVIINTAYFFNRYFIQTPKITAEKWNDGYQEVVDYVGKIEKNYDKVIISSAQAPSYIFYAWNLRYDPTKFQKEAQVNHTPDEHGLNFTRQFGKYYFTKEISAEITTQQSTEKVLYVGFPQEFRHESQVIYSRNNNPVFIIKE